MAVPRPGCVWGSKLLEFPPSLVRSHAFRKEPFGPLDPSGRIITTGGRADRLLAAVGGHGPLSFLTASSAIVTPKASVVAAEARAAASDDSGNAVGLSVRPVDPRPPPPPRSFAIIPASRACVSSTRSGRVGRTSTRSQPRRGPMPLESSTQLMAARSALE